MCIFSSSSENIPIAGTYVPIKNLHFVSQPMRTYYWMHIEANKRQRPHYLLFFFLEWWKSSTCRALPVLRQQQYETTFATLAGQSDVRLLSLSSPVVPAWKILWPMTHGCCLLFFRCTTYCCRRWQNLLVHSFSDSKRVMLMAEQVWLPLPWKCWANIQGLCLLGTAQNWSK